MTDDEQDAARERARAHHEWHCAINRFHYPDDTGPGLEHRSWMYEAKDAQAEVRRLPRLFQLERTGALRKQHVQCSMSDPVPVADNHLTCCLGVECRKCPELLALESPKLSPEQVDEIKAWTCVTHIISKGGDQAREGYILTTDDIMFWQNTYASLASNPEDVEP